MHHSAVARLTVPSLLNALLVSLAAPILHTRWAPAAAACALLARIAQAARVQPSSAHLGHSAQQAVPCLHYARRERIADSPAGLQRATVSPALSEALVLLAPRRRNFAHQAPLLPPLALACVLTAWLANIRMRKGKGCASYAPRDCIVPVAAVTQLAARAVQAFRMH